MAVPGAPSYRPPATGSLDNTMVDWDAQRAQAMQEALGGLAGLAAQAQQYAMQQHGAANQAQGAYQGAIEQPYSLAPPGAAALPYAAQQFSAALSGRPELAQQADQSLGMNRALLLQRRSQMLENLHEQSLAAAKRAEAADDLGTALKFNTKANLYLKQLDETMSSIRESQGRAEDRKTAEARQAEQLQFQFWQTRYVQKEETARSLVSAGYKDPATRARAEALERVYQSKVKPLQDALAAAQLGQNKKKIADLQSQLDSLSDQYIRDLNGLFGNQPAAATPPATVTPPGKAAPKVSDFKGTEAKRLTGRTIKEETADAERFLLHYFPGKFGNEIMEALVEKDSSGVAKGELLARATNGAVTYRGLTSAARKLPQRKPTPELRAR